MSLFRTLTGILQHGQKGVTKPQPTDRVKAPPPKPIADKQAVAEAQAKAQEIILEARNQALKIKSEAEQQRRKLQNEFSQRQAKMSKQQAEAARAKAANESKQQLLSKLERQLQTDKQELEKRRSTYKQKLQELSQLSKDQARQIIFDAVEKRLQKELNQTIKAAETKAQEEAQNRAREILIDALKHGATDYVAEYTVSTVKLPNEESKGRIIGKEGRNIRAFEKITGVDIDLDETPGEVRLSSFDPIRREVARVTLTRLLADGRIQPTRIEEYAKKARADLDRTAFEEGKKLCHAVGVYNLPKELVSLIGKYKYHFSEGQNLLSRTLEQVKIGVAIAEEVNANADTVRLGCLLHDIGRVIYDEEGNHVDLGVKLLKRYGLPHVVVDAVAQHHGDESFTSAEAVIVSVADSISTNRPGAQYENYDEYVKRLQRIEEIIKEFDGVTDAFVLQAGRDVQVIVTPDIISDEALNSLAFEIKERIREEMTYSGTISVTITRETRATAVAK